MLFLKSTVHLYDFWENLFVKGERNSLKSVVHGRGNMPNASSTLSITLKKAKALTPNLVSAFLLPDNNKCGMKMKYGAKYKNRANL